MRLHQRFSMPMIGALVLPALLWFARPAAADIVYVVTTVSHNGTLFPYAINNSGTIVGQTFNGHGFVLTVSGGFTDVPPPGSEQIVSFTGIDSTGHVIAQTVTAGKQHSYRWYNGTYSVPDVDEVLYNGLNDAGNRAGSIYNVGNGYTEGLLDATRFDAPESSYTVLTGISNAQGSAGPIESGWYQELNTSHHAFIRNLSQNGLSELVAPARFSAQDMTAQSINTYQEVGGIYRDGAGKTHGYVRASANQWYSIDGPGAQSTSVYGINDDGIVVGSYIDGNSSFVGFMAAPVQLYTMDDVVDILPYIAGLDTLQGVSDATRLDVDQDGRVTMKDAVTIIRKVNGLLPNP